MTILFDATRLLDRTGRSTPTGVDRVCLAYAEWLLANHRARLHPIVVGARGVRLIALDQFAQHVASFRKAWSGQELTRSRETEDQLRALTGETKDTSALKPPALRSPQRLEQRKGAGLARRTRLFLRARHGWTAVDRFLSDLPSSERSVYLNVSHTGLHNRSFLKKLHSVGIAPIAFVHDLIPITHPEYCRPESHAKHRVLMDNALDFCESLLVNSVTTADAIRAYCHQQRRTSPTIHVAKLGLEPQFLSPLPKRSPGSRYFVHIGTIEARKNLAFLLTIWRRLAETMGHEAPHLILIGRYGWENEAVLDLLERSPPLQHLVHHSTDLGDVALSRLVGDACAVLAPSFVEGFDLPAVEACAMGVPLIASDIQAHRELTPGALLLDPLDGLGWASAIQKTFEQGLPTQQSQPAPTWREHFTIASAALRISGIGNLELAGSRNGH